MWSFTALFSDVVTRPTPTSPGQTRQSEPDEANSVPSGENSTPWEASELSDIRLDISDIQEAIKNHDLWVQDAVVMRNDVDGLQATIQEHQSWMRDVTSVVRQLQAKGEHLANEVADIRHQLTLTLPGSGCRLPTTDSSGSGPGLPNANASAHAASSSAPAPAIAERGFGSKYVSTAHGDTKIDMNGVADADKIVNPGNGLLEADPDISSLVKTLSRQLDCGMRMIRSMVSTVEGSLVRQIDAERSARRAALAELRHEMASVSRRLTALDGESLTTSGASKESLLILSNGGCSGSAAQGAVPFATASRPQILEVMEAATANWRNSLDAVEHHTMEKFVEADRAIASLRADVAALRSEQQLQAVAAGTLALTSGGLSQQARQRCLTALGERAVVTGQSMHDGKQQQEDRVSQVETDAKQLAPLSGSRVSTASASEASRRAVDHATHDQHPRRAVIWPIQKASTNDGNG